VFVGERFGLLGESEELLPEQGARGVVKVAAEFVFQCADHGGSAAERPASAMVRTRKCMIAHWAGRNRLGSDLPRALRSGACRVMSQ
jgi:hypothetical protein